MPSDKVTVGQRFKAFRIEKGYSQNDLSEGICSYSVISHLENDRNIPSAKIMGKLAERLNVPLKEIMGENELTMDINFQVDMIRVYLEKQEYEYAFGMIIELKNKELLLEHQRRDLLIFEAHCCTRMGNPRQAVELLLPFVEQQERKRSEDDSILCDIYDKLGIAFFKLREFEKAYAAFENAYRISLGFPNFDHLAAKVTKNFGLTCNHLGLYDEAADYLEKAYQYYSSYTDLKSLADASFALAIAKKDESHLLQALSIFQSINSIQDAYLVRQYYAFHLEAKRNHQKAIQDLVYIANELENSCDYTNSLFTLGRAARVCVTHQEIEKARPLLEKGQEIIAQYKIHNQAVVADFYQVVALWNLSLGEFNSCVDFAKKSADIFSIIGIKTDYANSIELQAEAYENQGMFEEAYRLQKHVSTTLRQVRVRSE